MNLADIWMYGRLRLPNSLKYSDLSQETRPKAQERFTKKFNNYIIRGRRKPWEIERAIYANAKCDTPVASLEALENHLKSNADSSYITFLLFVNSIEREDIDALEQYWGGLEDTKNYAVNISLYKVRKEHNVAHTSDFALRLIEFIYEKQYEQYLSPKLLMDIYLTHPLEGRVRLRPIIQTILDENYFPEAKDVRRNLRAAMLELALKESDMPSVARFLGQFPRDDFSANQMCIKTFRPLLNNKTQHAISLELLDAIRLQDNLEIVPPLLLEEIFLETRHLGNIVVFEKCLEILEPDAKYLPIMQAITDYKSKFYFGAPSGADSKLIAQGKALTLHAHDAINQLGHPLSIPTKASNTTSFAKDVRYKSFDHVYLYGLTFGFIVLDSHFKPVNFHNPYLTDNILSHIKSLAGTETHLTEIAFIGDNFRPNNYAHFVLDYLPRIMAFKMLFPNKDMTYGTFRLDGTQFQQQYFDLLNIKETNRLNLKQHQLYKVSTLHTLSSSGQDFMHCFQGGLKDYSDPVNALSRHVIRKTAKPNPRIALLRDVQSGGRNFLNAPEVHDWLQNKGFDLINPVELSVSEQIRIMHGAKYVIGIHGAALANTAFCQSGAELIEVFPPYFGTRAFSTLAQTRDLVYRPIMGESDEDALPYPQVGWQNFTLPLSTLNALKLD